MKMIIGKQVFDQMAEEEKRDLRPVPCDCLIGDEAKPDCDRCLGGGVVYEVPISDEDMDAIVANLRRQGVPIGN